jgi:seryl-tRNA synthetase
LTGEIQSLKKDMNDIQKNEIAPAKKAKMDCADALERVAALRGKIAEVEKKAPILEEQRDKLLNKIGNVVDPEVPIGQDEDKDNLVVGLEPMPSGVSLPMRIEDLEGKYTPPPALPMTHDDLLWRIGGYEPIRGANVAGHRGYFLTNNGVLLNQAIIQFSIAFLMERGYNSLQPPFFMNKDVMSGIAQLEDFDEQLYKVSGKTDDPTGESEKYLIATSEQPICAYHKGDWLTDKEVPLRYAGISTCFRKEAGSSGKDIRGIFRVHQFEKIEQFVVTHDDIEESTKEQSRMMEAAEDFYKALGIPYRVVCIVSGALNDAAIKKYDLEGWFPGQNTYRELVSCSNCTDYQSRSMGTRYGMKKRDQATASHCHFLNSTLCATGRGICAILENHQTADGVVVPECLRSYMGGKDFLPFVRASAEMTKGEKGKLKSESKGKKDADKPPPAPK